MTAIAIFVGALLIGVVVGIVAAVLVVIGTDWSR